MKKNILLLIGLSIALMVNASNIPQVVHELGYVFQDPFTCKYDLVVKSTLDKPAYTAYYYYYDGGQPEQPFDKQKDSVTVSLDRGDCTIIVAAGNNHVINSPARKAANMEDEGEVPPEDLPIPGDFYVEQYDVYNVTVLHPVVEHFDTIYADLLTQKANYDLYSTFGGEEDGKAYCGDMYYAQLCEMFEDFTYLTYKKFKDMPYSVELEAGDYVYYVNTGAPHINVPARRAGATTYPIPTYYSLDDVWTDVFYIRVIEPDCYDNLVYTKWNDVLFVDNGGNSQGFERGDFVAYQWYNEGAAIEGEMGQWMRTKGAPQGRYYAEITTKDGKKVFSCPAEFETLPQSEPENPHQVVKSGPRKYLVDGKLVLDYGGIYYNVIGMQMK